MSLGVEQGGHRKGKTMKTKGKRQIKPDKWLLNEENNRRFAIAKESKRGYTFKLICDICGKETDENNPWEVRILKVITVRGQIDINITLCAKCVKRFTGITDPIIAFANTMLIQALNPKLLPIIEASIEEKRKKDEN